MICYLCPSTNEFIGGIRIIYNHVDILNRNGIEAAVLHETVGFKVTWFKNTTKVVYSLDDNNLLITPEVYSPSVFPGRDRIIFNQNYYLSKSIDHTCKGIMAISHHNAKLIRAKFPGIPVTVVNWSLPKDIYFYDPLIAKENIISFFGIKNTVTLEVVRKHLLGSSWKLVQLEGSDLEVANTLRKSKIFLQLGLKEGCPRPPAEAMACGCMVVGYDGGGGKDYMDGNYCYPCESDDLSSLLIKLNRAINNPYLTELSPIKSYYILNKYSAELEENLLLEAIKPYVNTTRQTRH